MEYGFSTYGLKRIYSKDNYKKIIYIDNASNRKVNYYLKDDVNMIVNKNDKNVKYKVNEEIYDIKAPIKKGDTVGELKLSYNNKVFKYDLIVKEDVNKANYFRVYFNIFKDIISGVKLK